MISKRAAGATARWWLLLLLLLAEATNIVRSRR